MMESSVASKVSWSYWLLVATLGGLLDVKFHFPGSKRKAKLLPSPGALPIELNVEER